MSTHQEFHITLPSNVKSLSDVEENTISSYKTTLKRRLIFPSNEDWRVGVSEIIYTKTWYNVSEPAIINFLLEDGTIHNVLNDIEGICKLTNCQNDLKKNIHIYNLKEYVFQNGEYEDILEIVKNINQIISNLANYFTIPPKFEFDQKSKTVKIIIGETINNVYQSSRCIPLLGKDLENILGLVYKNGETLSEYVERNKENSDDQRPITPHKDNVTETFDLIIGRINKFKGTPFNKEIFQNGTAFYLARRVVDFNAGLYSLYFYSNIVEDNFIGDEYAPLLRVVPVYEKNKFGSVVKETFDFPHFIKLKARDFDTIHIDIRDDTGSRVPFESGRVIVKLIFKK